MIFVTGCTSHCTYGGEPMIAFPVLQSLEAKSGRQASAHTLARSYPHPLTSSCAS